MPAKLAVNPSLEKGSLRGGNVPKKMKGGIMLKGEHSMPDWPS